MRPPLLSVVFSFRNEEDVLPELGPLLQATAAMPSIDYSQPLEDIRATARQGATAFRALYEPIPELLSVHDERIGDIAIRVYRPAAGRLPALVYFHGGGWWLGDLDSDDALCRKTAAACGMVVVSVDYRLAPEHQWPGPNEDCYSAVRWVADNADRLGVDGTDIAVGGQSAGGNLAAAVAMMCRDRGGPALSAQWLNVPATDLTLRPTESFERYGNGFGLDASDIAKCVEFFIGDGDPTHPYASPLLAEDLTGLAPALVTTAQCDPLCDMGERYAARLESAGVPVRPYRSAGHLHGTQALSALTPTADEFMAEIAGGLAALRSAPRQ